VPYGGPRGEGYFLRVSYPCTRLTHFSEIHARQVEGRCRENREPFKQFQGHLRDSQGQNLALTVLHVPHRGTSLKGNRPSSLGTPWGHRLSADIGWVLGGGGCYV